MRIEEDEENDNCIHNRVVVIVDKWEMKLTTV